MDWLAGLHSLIGSDEDGILWWQMTVRAGVIFTFGLLLIRLFGRRAFGKYTPLDLVLAIVVGSNLSRAMTATVPFVPTLAATAAIVVFYWLLTIVTAQWRFAGRILKGEPVHLARHGEIDRKAMLRAGISEGDLEEAARRSNVAGIREIEEAILERSGEISVFRRQ